MARSQGLSILHEMMRSFTVLARTLNLSRAVRELGTTRQTVRRHIDILEEAKGGPLFELEDRQYHLTELGRNSVREAQELLARGEAWFTGQSDHIRGLFHVAYDQDPNFYYYLQQHPLSRMWQDSSPLIQKGFQQWALAGGSLDSPELDLVRPYMMIYRRHENQWLCVEVGEKSSYATWFGAKWGRSSVARASQDLPGGENVANLLAQPFLDVYATHAVRLDHICTLTPRDSTPELFPVSFQRLLVGCRFPDDSFALGAIIDRSHNIDVKGLKPEIVQAMPEELVMNVDPSVESMRT